MVTLHVFYRPGTHLLCYLILFVSSDNCCKRFTELNEWTVGIATGIMSFVAGVIIHKMPDSYNDKAIPLLVVGASSVVGLFITSVIMIICYCKKKCC